MLAYKHNIYVSLYDTNITSRLALHTAGQSQVSGQNPAYLTYPPLLIHTELHHSRPEMTDSLTLEISPPIPSQSFSCLQIQCNLTHHIYDHAVKVHTFSLISPRHSWLHGESRWCERPGATVSDQGLFTLLTRSSAILVVPIKMRTSAPMCWIRFGHGLSPTRGHGVVQTGCSSERLTGRLCVN